MTASTPKSTQIINAMVDVIRGINGAPDYHNTLTESQVSGHLKHYSKIPIDLFPHVCVFHNGEDRAKEPGHLLNLLNVGVCVYFKNNQDNDDGFQENLLQDIEVALAQDVRQGLTFVHDTWVETITRDSEVFDPIQIFTLVVPARYNFIFGEP